MKPLRGLAIVEKLIAASPPKKPLSTEAIAAMKLGDGAPLPPSLARFLAHDGVYLDLRPRSFREMMEAEFDRNTADIYDGFAQILPGSCYVVGRGSDSRCFMYVGEPDEHGEYPIMTVDTDDTPFVCLEYPGLDVFLGDIHEVITIKSGHYGAAFEDPVYGPAMIDQARRNFRGFQSLDWSGDTIHVDGEEAATVELEKIMGSLSV